MSFNVYQTQILYNMIEDFDERIIFLMMFYRQTFI